MNGYELWRLREQGLSGVEVQRRNSEFWAKRNLPAERCLNDEAKLNLTCGNPTPNMLKRPRFMLDDSFASGSSSSSSRLSRDDFTNVIPDASACHWTHASSIFTGDDFVPAAFKPTTLISSEESLREAASLKMPQLFQERNLDVGRVNKIFASRWYDERHIVFGSKCNGLYIMDVEKAFQGLGESSLTRIPNLASPNTHYVEKSGGIHTIDVNPSGTLLATGADSPCDIAVYKMPGFEPLAVGDRTHKDWIFDLKWLDDQFLISGSRDNVLAMFKFDEDDLTGAAKRDQNAGSDDVTYPSIQCVASRKIHKLEHDRIRTITYNRFHRLITVVSSKAVMVQIDARSMRQLRARRLGFDVDECVCACHDPWDERSTCVGSRSLLLFLDARSLHTVHEVELPYRNGTDVQHYSRGAPSGVRSLSWRGPLVTLGTGGGDILFYDVRVCKFLTCGQDQKRANSLRISGGWQHFDRDDLNLRTTFADIPASTAVYTHSFDPSGTRLFAAGGPICEAVSGSYAAIWN